MYNKKCIVFDIGAESIRVGNNTSEEPLTFRNLLARPKKRKRIYVANEIDELENFFDLTVVRPFERGYMCSSEHQQQILNNICRRMKPSSTNAIVTEPFFNFEKIQSSMDEIFFEQHGFAGLVRQPAPKLATYAKIPDFDNKACMVLDTGFSFSHSAAIYDGCVLTQSVRRVDVGGKLLTNYLKEVISFKSVNLMDDFLLVDHIKKACCKCALSYDASLKQIKDNRDYVKYLLPSAEEKVGRIKNDNKPLTEYDQTVRLKSEQINVPEVLFNPGLIHMKQCGIAEAVIQSIEALPKAFKDFMPNNILLVGGNVNFKGFKERMEVELRKYFPDHVPVRIFAEEKPEFTAWKGAAQFTTTQDFHEMLVTRKEYFEYGPNICYRKWHIP